MRHHQTTNKLLSHTRLLTLTKLGRLTSRPLAFAGLILTSTAIVLSVLALPVQAAGSTTLYLSPASSTVNVGSNLAVTIWENSGSTAVNAVEANLSYPSNLQYASTDFSTSAFEIAASSTGGSGTVDIARGTVNLTLTGAQIVGIVNFNVLASGSASISFLSSSAVAATSNSANTVGTMTGGTYTLQTPPATPPVTTTPSKSTTTTTTTTTKPATTTTTTKPATTTTPSSTTTTAPTTTPVVSPTTYLVAVDVLNAQGKPEAGVTVTLAGITAVSDATGIASFTAVPAGYHQITIKQGSTIQKETIEVSSAKSPTAVQQFNYKLASATTVPVVVWLIVGLLIIVGLGTIFLRRSRLRPDLAYGSVPATVLGGDSPLPTANGSTAVDVGQIIAPTSSPVTGGSPIIAEQQITNQMPINNLPLPTASVSQPIPPSTTPSVNINNPPSEPNGQANEPR